MEDILQQQKITNSRLLRIENKVLDIKNLLPKVFDSLRSTLDDSFMSVEKVLFGIDDTVKTIGIDIHTSITNMNKRMEESFEKLNDDLAESFNVLRDTITGQAEAIERKEMVVSEEEAENIRRQQSTIALLEKIEENTGKKSEVSGMDLGDLAQMAGALGKSPLGIFGKLLDGVVGLFKKSFMAIGIAAAAGLKLLSPLAKSMGGVIAKIAAGAATIFGLRKPKEIVDPKKKPIDPNTPLDPNAPKQTTVPEKKPSLLSRAGGAVRGGINAIGGLAGGGLLGALGFGYGAFKVMESGELDKPLGDIDWGKIAGTFVSNMIHGVTMGLVSAESVQKVIDGFRNNEYVIAIFDSIFSTLDGTMWKSITDTFDKWAISIEKSVTEWVGTLQKRLHDATGGLLGKDPEEEKRKEIEKKWIEEDKKRDEEARKSGKFNNGVRATGSTAIGNNNISPAVNAYKIAMENGDTTQARSIYSSAPAAIKSEIDKLNIGNFDVTPSEVMKAKSTADTARRSKIQSRTTQVSDAVEGEKVSQTAATIINNNYYTNAPQTANTNLVSGFNGVPSNAPQTS